MHRFGSSWQKPTSTGKKGEGRAEERRARQGRGGEGKGENENLQSLMEPNNQNTSHMSCFSFSFFYYPCFHGCYVRIRGQPCGVSSHLCTGSEDQTLATRLQNTVSHLASPRHMFLNIVEFCESWSRNSDNEHFTVLGAV